MKKIFIAAAVLFAFAASASADDRGARVLAGAVVLGVGCLNAAVSGTALAVALIKRFLEKRTRH